MGIIFYQGKPLFRRGKIAMHTRCCCTLCAFKYYIHFYFDLSSRSDVIVRTPEDEGWEPWYFGPPGSAKGWVQTAAWENTCCNGNQGLRFIHYTIAFCGKVLDDNEMMNAVGPWAADQYPGLVIVNTDGQPVSQDDPNHIDLLMGSTRNEASSGGDDGDQILHYRRPQYGCTCE